MTGFSAAENLEGGLSSGWMLGSFAKDRTLGAWTFARHIGCTVFSKDRTLDGSKLARHVGYLAFLKDRTRGRWRLWGHARDDTPDCLGLCPPLWLCGVSYYCNIDWLSDWMLFAQGLSLVRVPALVLKQHSKLLGNSCFSASSILSALPSFIAQTLIVARNEILPQVFYRVPGVGIETVTELAYTVQRTTSIGSTIDDLVGDITCPLSFFCTG